MQYNFSLSFSELFETYEAIGNVPLNLLQVD